MRGDLRNKPDLIVDGKNVSYGALTGEKEAEYFIKYGMLMLEEGDTVVFATDGMIPVLEMPDFYKYVNLNSALELDQSLTPYLLRLAKQDYKFGKERTVVVYRH